MVKHGSVYVRVHPCRLTLEHDQQNHNTSTINTESQDVQSTSISKNVQLFDKTVISSSDESEEETNDITTESTADHLTTESTTDHLTTESTTNHLTTESTTEHLTNESTTDHLMNERIVTRPKVKQKIKYLPAGQEKWKVAEVISKAGKNKGKYENWLNIRHDDDDRIKSIDWKNDVQEWCILNETEKDDEVDELIEKVKHMGIIDDEDDIQELLLFTDNGIAANIIDDAKTTELENWKRNKVYQEVTYNGQKCISVRWVFTEKYVDGKKIVKARLVARGFEESEPLQVDSPTCSKESLRLVASLIVSKGWICNGIDVKAAFLQGKHIERDVYIEPPPEIEKKDMVWKLNVCVYGLSDTSRTWYLRIKEELVSLGAKCCRYEPALFYWHCDGELNGLITIHVDDLFWGGSKAFEDNVINPFKCIFEIGKESSQSFKYLGLQIKQNPGNISIDQINYCRSLNVIVISKERKIQKHLPLGKEELKKLRVLIGQMNWIATQTRPDLLFDCCDLASSLKSATVDDINKANKVLKKLNDDVVVRFPSLDSSGSLKFIVYNEAIVNNMFVSGNRFYKKILNRPAGFFFFLRIVKFFHHYTHFKM